MCSESKAVYRVFFLLQVLLRLSLAGPGQRRDLSRPVPDPGEGAPAARPGHELLHEQGQRGRLQVRTCNKLLS